MPRRPRRNHEISEFSSVLRRLILLSAIFAGGAIGGMLGCSIDSTSQSRGPLAIGSPAGAQTVASARAPRDAGGAGASESADEGDGDAGTLPADAAGSSALGGRGGAAAAATRGGRGVDPTFGGQIRAGIALRDLTIHMRGFGDDLNRFTQFRIVAPDGSFAGICVIHEGIPRPDYDLVLPKSLLAEEDYRLDFWFDHNGNSVYDKPPADHGFSLPITKGKQNAELTVRSSTNYTDVEAIAPSDDHGLLLSISGMSDYADHLLDVRLTESVSGRLAGRQLRQVPGDIFDVTVASVVHTGVAYRIDVGVDLDDDGQFEPASEPGWTLESVASISGLHMKLAATAAAVPTH